MEAIYQKNFESFKDNFNFYKIPIGVQNIGDHNKHYDNFAFKTLWANARIYASSLVHVNLYEINEATLIDSCSYVLVRDGLFTLIDFFNRFPDPSEFGPLFLVPRIFRNYIPEAWMKKILCFEMEYCPPSFTSEHKINHLIIKGVLEKDLYSLERLSANVLEVLNNERISKITLAVQPVTNNFSGQKFSYEENFASIANHFMKFFYQEVDREIDINFVSWDEFYKLHNLNCSQFINLNYKELLYVDDFQDFLLLSKGSKPHNIRAGIFSARDCFVPLSFYHGITILEKETMTTVGHDELTGMLKDFGAVKGNSLSEKCFQAISGYAKSSLENFTYLKTERSADL